MHPPGCGGRRRWCVGGSAARCDGPVQGHAAGARGSRMRTCSPQPTVSCVLLRAQVGSRRRMTATSSYTLKSAMAAWHALFVEGASYCTWRLARVVCIIVLCRRAHDSPVHTYRHAPSQRVCAGAASSRASPSASARSCARCCRMCVCVCCGDCCARVCVCVCRRRADVCDNRSSLTTRSIA